jgi:hypothetical protein
VTEVPEDHKRRMLKKLAHSNIVAVTKPDVVIHESVFALPYLDLERVKDPSPSLKATVICGRKRHTRVE